MSFRKRGEVVGGPAPVRQSSPVVPSQQIRGQPSIPLRGPSNIPLRPQPNVADTQSSVRGNLPARGSVLGHQIPGTPVSRGIGRPSPQTVNAAGKQLLGSHPGVKPSILTSQACISTGSNDVDKILGHQGLPLGQCMMIEENGTTDFSSTLLKIFLSQGIVQNRLDPKVPNTHCILVGMNQEWAKVLPGVYKGSSKERKKAVVKENESKVSVSNLLDQQQQQQQQPQKANDMKIAWRYGLQKQKNEDSEDNDKQEESYPHFNTQFDITSTLIPAAGANDLTCIPLNGPSFQLILKQIDSTIARFQDRVIRVVVPLFLNPMFYDPKLCSTSEAISFIHGLRSIAKKYDERVTVLISLNLDLYPRSNPLVTIVENLIDAVIELRPFDPELYELMERIYRQQPTKIKHGHLNVIRLPVLSDTGMMCIKDMEYSFKNGKKRFEVEEWSIPIDEEENTENDSTQTHDHAHRIESSNPTAAAPKQTLQNLDF